MQRSADALDVAQQAFQRHMRDIYSVTLEKPEQAVALAALLGTRMQALQL